ncbi:NAD-dependent malic enzyme [Clostridia bacterium]|nr:NAD-dependent malic enzyme [Clostridia bacterium]
MNIFEESLLAHKKAKGKIAIKSKMPLESNKDLSIAYTPGVAEPCRHIAKDEMLAYDYTNKGNLVAIVSDGTAVLGLGDIGGQASMPVMEGKAILFKEFGDVDAFPICLSTKNPDEIVAVVKAIAPTFGGINIEDIAAPACFEIERRLKKELSIPVFHDDQHGTAVVTLAALINALRVVEKEMSDVRVVINGAGAAGIAIAKLLLQEGVEHLVLCDRTGILYEKRIEGMNEAKREIAAKTNKGELKGTLAEAMKGADVFIGVSSKDVVKEEMVASMNDGAIVMAMANPDPEINPDLAKKAGAAIVCTGRSDYPNQVNNVLAFPGIFRGALDVMATDINEEMKVAAAHAIADLVKVEELSTEYVIPDALNKEIGIKVGEKVAEAAIRSGVARKK